MRISILPCLMGLVVFDLPPAAEAADNAGSSSNAYVIPPDGVTFSDGIPATQGTGNPAGTPQWFTFRAEMNRSYVVEILSNMTYAINNPPQPAAALFAQDGVSALPSGVTASETTYCTPSGGAYTQVPNRRYAVMNAGGANTWVMIRVTSALNYETSEVQFFQIRIFETTLMGTRWTANGYNFYLALHNGSGCTASTAVVWYDEAGSVVATDTFNLAPHGSLQLIKAPGDATFGGKRGGLEILYNQSPGLLQAHTYAINATTGALLQFPVFGTEGYGRGGR